MSFGPAIPALPVSTMAAAASFYRELLGFSVVHAEDDFAMVSRDECVLHLWLAGDGGWRDRPDFTDVPIRSGAESFLAGTASCRIEVHGDQALDDPYAEMEEAEVLHPASHAGVRVSDYGTRELHVSDQDGNLLSFFLRV